MIKYVYLSVVFLTLSCAGPGSYRIYYEGIMNQIPGDDFIAIREDFYNEQPFSFAYLKYGKRSPVVLVLASVDNGIFHWVSQDRVSIFTNNIGKIINTRGLDNDIFLTNLQNITLDQEEYSFYSNFYNPELLNILTFNRKLESKNIEYEYFIGDMVPAKKVRYLSELPMIKNHFKNEYIIGNDGKPLSTTQKIHPFLPEISIYFYYK